MADEKSKERFGWNSLDEITIVRKGQAKTDKVSTPDDDLWDNLEFEWIEE